MRIQARIVRKHMFVIFKFIDLFLNIAVLVHETHFSPNSIFPACKKFLFVCMKAWFEFNYLNFCLI